MSEFASRQFIKKKAHSLSYGFRKASKFYASGVNAHKARSVTARAILDEFDSAEEALDWADYIARKGEVLHTEDGQLVTATMIHESLKYVSTLPKHWKVK